MAPRSAAGVGGTERFVTSTFRFFNDIVTAVGDGIRAHKDFSVRVGQGADPVQAVALAVLHHEQH